MLFTYLKPESLLYKLDDVRGFWCLYYSQWQHSTVHAMRAERSLPHHPNPGSGLELHWCSVPTGPGNLWLFWERFLKAVKQLSSKPFKLSCEIIACYEPCLNIWVQADAGYFMCSQYLGLPRICHRDTGPSNIMTFLWWQHTTYAFSCIMTLVVGCRPSMLMSCLSEGVQTPWSTLGGLRLSLPSKVEMSTLKSLS
jgi:hypothetical protein